jgi:hypothetical protein
MLAERINPERDAPTQKSERRRGNPALPPSSWVQSYRRPVDGRCQEPCSSCFSARHALRNKSLSTLSQVLARRQGSLLMYRINIRSIHFNTLWAVRVLEKIIELFYAHTGGCFPGYEPVI